ncbi:MAG: protein kinase [Desulfobacteraceae bacterium]|nr:protein kinase [Desulfobacteraceae bacterium]MBC2751806.1 protein kinase [Desulfobacteraceae bacterium]
MTETEPLQAHRGQILLNRFQLSHPLGQGGMGEVWRAHDRDLDLDIAIKLLHPALASAPAQVEFLKNECRLARRLNHPHIVPVYDFHHDGEAVFISMAWVDGPSFDRWNKTKERPWEDRLRPLGSAALALAYVHGQGLIHRDVKAGNILMDRKDHPRLTDFGIAGVYRIDAERTALHGGGSRHCMSPQQRQGLPPHPADDIYSFGVLLLETLTGSDGEIDERLSADGLRRSLGAAAPLPPELITMVVGMLATRREDRPESMAQVVSAMDQALAGHRRRTIPPRETPLKPEESASAASADVITPQPFAAQENRQGPGGKARSWQMPAFLVILALLIMAGGGLLLHYLARNPLTPQPAAIATPTPPPAASQAPQTPLPPESPPTGDESTAEKALADWRQALGDLEAIGGPEWAPEAYAAISSEAMNGDEAFLQTDYTGAVRHYTTAAQEARGLLAKSPDALARLLTEGRTALNQGDGTQAGSHFTLALKIDPQNPVALRGLERAAKIADVVALMQTGEAHETAGNLALALADFEAALALDPEWPPAQAAVPRVRNQVAAAQFEHHMSAGLAAFHRRSYAEARRDINRALAFKPRAPEALDALNQIDAAGRDDRIAALRRQAQTAEKTESWPQVLDHYRQVLEIDPTIQFAVQGAARAEERLRLEKRVAYYMAHPGDLANDVYLAKAEQLLVELRQVAPQGPRLQSQIASLDRMVQNAQATVVVTLTSDDQTEVTVYRVGRLGQFLSRTLELRPGTYTVMGARDGYKDVRHTIRIRPGQGPTQVAVQCTEKI